MSRVPILGVPIDALTLQQALQRISAYFRMEGQFHVATPNPEMLALAQSHEQFRTVLQKTALNVPDGIGLVWAMKRACPTGESFGRVTGVDMMQALCSAEARICPPERVFLLGAAEGVAERAKVALRSKNPALQIVGTYAGSPQEEHDEEIVARINNAAALAPHSSGRSEGGPTLLFVAYGVPAQDLWIARNLPKLPTVKVAMGVGGALDFIAGKRRRAPTILQHMGLEWLWRLLLEPKRIRRIFTAVIVFPWMVLREGR